MKISNPELKVVRFSAEDVIATSGMLSLVTLSGFGDDDNEGNNTWTVGNTTYRADTDYLSDLQTALETYGDGAGDELGMWLYDNSHSESLTNLWNKDREDWGDYNGTYTWTNSGAGYWYKISN